MTPGGPVTHGMPRVDVQTPVLVLDAGYGGLGVARSLGRWGVAAYATAPRVGAPALASRYWADTFVWDFGQAPPAESVRFLLERGRSLGRRAVLVPTSDTTVAIVAAHAGALADRYVFPDQPVDLIETLIDKQALYERAARLGVPTARTVVPRSSQDVHEFLDAAGLPVVVKGADPRLPHGTAKAVLHDRSTVLAYCDWASGGGGRVVLQEFVPGGDDATWMFNAYFDHRSECLAAFTGRKIRQYPAAVGVASLGVCERNPQVETISRRFLQQIGYRGMVDVDYRYDHRDGTYRILDVNPRIGATFRLFVDDRGLDVARCGYLDATGQPVQAGAPLEGRKWLLEEDLLTSLRLLGNGNLTLGAWAASLRGVRELAWWAGDDMRPFFARVARATSSARRPRHPVPTHLARWSAEDYEPSTSR